MISRESHEMNKPKHDRQDQIMTVSHVYPWAEMNDNVWAVVLKLL